MKRKALLNTTLRINAAFSFFSGLDFILFDRTIVSILTGEQDQSILPTGIILIGFAVFVFSVSMMKSVNKNLVGVIIGMDLVWVVGSGVLVVAGSSMLTVLGQVLIIAIAVVIGIFAYFQVKGLRQHLAMG